jgi:hypothetical protein
MDLSFHDHADGTVSYSDRQRQNIIEDVAHWKVDHEKGSDWPGLDKFLDALAILDDTALTGFWFRTVGQWVLKESDLPWPAYVSEKTYVAVQFGKTVRGKQTDYGFVCSLDIRDKIAAKLQ